VFHIIYVVIFTDSNKANTVVYSWSIDMLFCLYILVNSNHFKVSDFPFLLRNIYFEQFLECFGNKTSPYLNITIFKWHYLIPHKRGSAFDLLSQHVVCRFYDATSVVCPHGHLPSNFVILWSLIDLCMWLLMLETNNWNEMVTEVSESRRVL